METRSKSRLRLLEAELAKIVEFGIEELSAERIILFGSMAVPDGKVGEWADIDLVIVAATKLPFHRRAGEVLKKTRPEVGVDLLIYTPFEWECMKTESPFVREEVLAKGKVVYERSPRGVCYDSRHAGIGFL